MDILRHDREFDRPCFPSHLRLVSVFSFTWLSLCLPTISRAVSEISKNENKKQLVTTYSYLRVTVTPSVTVTLLHSEFWAQSKSFLSKFLAKLFGCFMLRYPVYFGPKILLHSLVVMVLNPDSANIEEHTLNMVYWLLEKQCSTEILMIVRMSQVMKQC